MDNLIQQLKDNEKPFGMMSEEMQEKANEIGCTEFDYYGANVWESYPCGDFYNDQACRLRADYEDEPEIVECEITEEEGHLHFRMPNSAIRHSLHQACDHRDFSGFKFESGQVEFSPIVFKSSCSTKSICQFRDLADLEVLHVTHVLFRLKKQE